MIRRTAIAIARNQAHRILGGATRGGHRTRAWATESRAAHAQEIFDALAPHVGPVAGKTGLEIGPGDNLDVCRLFVGAGASRMVAAERFAHPTDIPSGVDLLVSVVECLALPPESIDFVYSNDVLEHVADVPAAFASIARVLKPGGVSVHSVDLRGHNTFNDPADPLSHLACPDWLYRLMHSHVVTSNRVRHHEFVAAAEAAGLETVRQEATAETATSYVARLRPRLLPRWRVAPHLGTLQLLLVSRKR